MHALILWTHKSDYFVRFLRTLSEKQISVTFLHFGNDKNAPFAEMGEVSEVKFIDATCLTSADIILLIKQTNPDFAMVSSWNITKYMFALKVTRLPLILCMDNQWKGNLRQILGVFLWRLGLYPKIEAFLVPGFRQETFARKLTWKTKPVLQGLYSSVFDNRVDQKPKTINSETFIFVGRIIKEKGIDRLLEAYQIYRNQVETPWPLKLVGDGPFLSDLELNEGVLHLGFLQQNNLERELQNSSVLILASEFEPWGVVIHDAACMGLPIIATKACGATDSFLEDNLNGFLLEKNDPIVIAEALLKMHLLDRESYIHFSSKSIDLSRSVNYESTANRICNLLKCLNDGDPCDS